MASSLICSFTSLPEAMRFKMVAASSEVIRLRMPWSAATISIILRAMTVPVRPSLLASSFTESMLMRSTMTLVAVLSLSAIMRRASSRSS